MFGYIFELLVGLFLVNIQNKRILKYLPNEMNHIIDIGAHDGIYINNSVIFQKLGEFNE